VCCLGSDGTPQGEKEKEERPPELPLLSEQLNLDELWDMLGECLKELEESHDQHAVLGKLWPDGPGLLIYSGALSASLIFFLPDYSSPSGLHESSKERIFSPNFIIRKKKRFAFSFGSSYLLLFRLGESL